MLRLHIAVKIYLWPVSKIRFNFS